MNQENDLTNTQPTDQFPIVARSQPNDAHDEEDIDLAEQQHLNRSYFSPPQPGLGVLIPHDFINTALADLPAYIPGLTQNVQSHDGGINKAALEVHRELGLLFNLLPYFGMADGDFCELFWGDSITPVALRTVSQDDIDNGRMISLYIPRARITDGSVSPVFIRVTPLGGNVQETKRFNFKVDTALPGGRNPVASTLQNENLPKPILPQNIIDFGVTEKDAQDGVRVTFNFYPLDTTQPQNTHRAVRDRIRFSVGGVFADIPPITESQAAGRQPITVTLYHGFWQQVGSGSRVCEYEVIDECGNSSDGWSPAQLLKVELNDGAEPNLPEAYFDEAPEDILNHDELDGQDATIVVAINRLGYNVGDIIRVTVLGRTVSGTTIVTTYDSAPLTSTTVRQITLPCPNADLRKLIGGRLQLSYVRIRSNLPDRKSESILVDVTGTPIERDLARPIIIEANGGVLDPQLLTVTVDVPIYDGRNQFDLVTLILDGKYPNGDRYYNEFDRSAGSGIIRFQLRNGPNGDIAKLEGGSIRFLYRVINADGTRTSLDETVQIGNVSATLPEPQVLEAPPPQYQFDPAEHPNDATVTVLSNTDFLEGDTVTLFCVGTAAGGTQPARDFPILKHWVGRDLPFTLERRYITPNLDKGMSIYYERRRPQAATRTSIAVDMKVGSRRQLKVPRVVEATVYNEKISIINPRHVLPPNREEVTIRVTVDGFPASANIKVFIIGRPGIGAPDIPEKPARPDQGENYVSFTVPNAFLAAYLGGECTVLYYLIEFGQSTKSDELTLEVENLSEQDFELVSIPEASGGVINTAVANNVRIDKWPFFRAGQPVSILLRSTTNRDLRLAVSVTSAEFNAGRTLDLIPASYLSSLDNNSEVEVVARVSMDGSGSLETAQYFKVATYVTRKGAGEIIREITVGNGPAKIVISRDGTTACVTNSRTSAISVINLATNAVRTLTYNYAVYRLALHPTDSRLFISAYGAAAGYHTPVLNISSFSFSYPFNFGVPAHAICLNPSGSRLLVSTNSYAGSTALYGYNTVNNQPATNYVGSPDARAATVDPQGISVFTTGLNTERFIFSSGVRTHTFANGGLAQELAHSPLNASLERLYVSVSALNRLVIYNTANDGLTLVTTLTGLLDPRGIAFHPTLPRAYVAELAGNRVRVIDTTTETVVGTITGFDQPDGVACTPDGQYLLVCNSGNTTVAKVSI
jgi:DNA-binding beta-propeller fold protein YncE